MAILRVRQPDGSWAEVPALRGSDGNGIESVTLNDDYTLTIRFTDGTEQTTESIRGDKGDKGVSITKVEQTSISTEDGGGNVITVTLSNGDKETFTVMNGSKGNDGKSAYQIALNNGFVGSEDDWLYSLRVKPNDIGYYADGGTPSSSDLLVFDGGTPFTTDEILIDCGRV